MLKVVIDGGPGTGKTSIIKELKKRKYKVVPEAARIIFARDKRRWDRTKAHLKQLQEEIWSLGLKHYQQTLKSKRTGIIFFDRGIIGALGYFILGGIHISKNHLKEARKSRFDYIFIPEPLPRKFYETDKVRCEDYKKSLSIHNKIVSEYRKFGYKPIKVPFASVKERTDFILKRIKSF